MSRLPTFKEENKLWKKGFQGIAGIDEVGRGPLAGPVVAAAVIFSKSIKTDWIDDIQDSKKLSSKKRELLAKLIKDEAVSYSIGVIPREQVDFLNILEATKLAMKTAINQLSVSPDALLIDALKLPEIPIHQKSIIKGDSISRSIAAASIVAKVHRDTMMKEYDEMYPGYGFARNMGYGTSEHLEKLQEIGACPIHRTSFAPVRRVLENNV